MIIAQLFSYLKLVTALRWWVLLALMTLAHGVAVAADLYLLSYVPFGVNSPRGGQVAIALYRLADGQLREVPLASEPPARTDFLLSDPESRLVVFGQTTYMPFPVALMSMETPGQLRDFELNIPGWIVDLAYIESVPGDGRLLVFNLFNNDALTHGKPADRDKVMTFSTLNDKWAEATPDIYRYVRVTGGAEGYRKRYTNAMGLSQSGGGQLAAFARGTVPVGPPLPPSLRFSPREGPVLLLSSSHFMAVADVTLIPDRHSVPYRILDRRTDTWFPRDIPGNESWNVRAFGPWMAGIVDEGLHDKPFRLSPGRHKLDPRAPLETVDEYLEVEQIYRSGRLFLYNTETRRYYEWDTHNGDCEIILVEDGQVYYRVDQVIYQAKIGERALGESQSPGRRRRRTGCPLGILRTQLRQMTDFSSGARAQTLVT